MTLPLTSFLPGQTTPRPKARPLWQFLNSYKDGVITADTAGRYLLTNQNLRFGDIKE